MIDVSVEIDLQTIIKAFTLYESNENLISVGEINSDTERVRHIYART